MILIIARLFAIMRRDRERKERKRGRERKRERERGREREFSNPRIDVSMCYISA
jgi:hypothetical protein